MNDYSGLAWIMFYILAALTGILVALVILVLKKPEGKRK